MREGRFKGERETGVPEFTASIYFDHRLYPYDIAGSIAHVTMLASAGIIPEETATAITAELKNIKSRLDNGEFQIQAEMEDIHMHIEHALIEVLGDEGARLHTARSRNDQIALDIRLYLRDETDAMLAGIRDFQRILVTKASDNAEVIMPGFTHLQHAQPVLFAHHLLAYVEMLERDLRRLHDGRKRLDVMPLGAGALAGSTLPIDRQKVAELLGFGKIARNSMDAVADRDFACELLAGLAILMMHISRLCEDVILWCSPEFGFAEPADSFCTGSSLMPQKKNPDVVELTRGKTARVYGALISLLTLCKGLPLTYNSDLQEDKEQLFDAIDNVKKVLDVFPRLLATLQLNPDKMREAASNPYLMMTDLAEELVQLGVPFRNAHHQVGSLVNWCRKNDRCPTSLTLAEFREHAPEANEACLELFSPESSIAKREIPGATGYQQVKQQLEGWQIKLQN